MLDRNEWGVEIKWKYTYSNGYKWEIDRLVSTRPGTGEYVIS